MIFAVFPLVALPVAGLFYCLIQMLAAIPWLIVVFRIDRRTLRGLLPRAVAILVVGAVLVAVDLFFLLGKELLGTFGRGYALLLEMLLMLDLFGAVFALMRRGWLR